MRKTLFILAIGCVLLAPGTADKPLASSPQSIGRATAIPILPGQTAKVPAIAKPAAIRDFGKVPVYFIPNAGQMDGPVEFYVKGSDEAVYFTPEGVTFALRYGEDKRKPERLKKDVSGYGPAARENDGPKESKCWVVKMDFLGANKDVKPQGVDETGAKISYFRGKPEEWKAGLSAYSKIIYKNLWPGIDLIYRGQRDKLKYEFIVHPGADPATIKLAWRGADKVRVDENGRLEVATPAGSFVDETPSAYQEAEGRQVGVDMKYDLRKLRVSANELSGKEETPSYSCGFAVGAYDKARDLVLDPATLIYCGFIGGSKNDSANCIAVDSVGNAYVAGYAFSEQATFPVTVGPDLTYNTLGDAFVAKVNASGTVLIYCGYIGGTGTNEDRCAGIAVDGSGNAYVTGDTNSSQTSFPVTVGPSLTINGKWDCFVAKINASGTALIYCGYIGGSLNDIARGIAVDGSGNAYVTGFTESNQTTFPVTVGPDLTYNGGLQDGFVAKVNASGTALVYCGYIGGSDDDQVRGIAVDGSGNAYVTGLTRSVQVTFPATVGPDVTHNGETDAFVAKVNASGTSLVYCGYIGGADIDFGFAIAVDGSGNAYVTGYTTSYEDKFPVTVGPDLTYHGAGDAFIAKVNSSGTALAYCGYIGGPNTDGGYGIAADGSGNVFVVGYTESDQATFPVTVGPDLTHNGGEDAYVARVNSTGTAFIYCGYIGGSSDDRALGIAIDEKGYAFVVGETYSSQATFPVTVGPDLTHNGVDDAFVAMIRAVNALTIAAGEGGTTSPAPGTYAYDVGASVNIQATALAGYRFGSWRGDITGTTNPVTITMNANKNITANFIRRYTLTIAAGAGGTANPAPGTYTYDEGASVSIQALPATAYQFDAWTGDASGSANPLTVVMTANKSIQANFSKVMKPPLSLTGEKLVNRNVSMVEYVVRLRWQANTANTGTITYRVYQVEDGQTTAITDIGAGKYEYIVRKLQKTKSYRFGVTAVNSLGWESDMVEVTVQ